MMTPPLSIWARPFLVVQVDVSGLMSWWNLRSGAHVSHAPGRLSHADLDAPSSATVTVRWDLGCHAVTRSATAASACLAGRALQRKSIPQDGPACAEYRESGPPSAIRLAGRAVQRKWTPNQCDIRCCARWAGGGPRQ